jgi:NTP pyrophosphatase (non-canonical NTP hydrolase)
VTAPADRTSAALIELSRWIDASNNSRDREALLWGRISKIGEEFGEAIQALIGYTGQNPRKGFTHSRDDVQEELLDVAVTALGAVEHLRGNDGRALAELDDKIRRVHARAMGGGL